MGTDLAHEGGLDLTWPVDVIVAEALDRLSRDQEHIAALYKRMQFLGVRT